VTPSAGQPAAGPSKITTANEEKFHLLGSRPYPGHFIPVAQISNLLYRGIAFRRASARVSAQQSSTPCRVQLGDTAD